jgi:hypothetical protein
VNLEDCFVKEWLVQHGPVLDWAKNKDLLSRMVSALEDELAQMLLQGFKVRDGMGLVQLNLTQVLWPDCLGKRLGQGLRIT